MSAFFNPISLVHLNYLPFFLSETVEEPFLFAGTGVFDGVDELDEQGVYGHLDAVFARE